MDVNCKDCTFLGKCGATQVGCSYYQRIEDSSDVEVREVVHGRWLKLGLHWGMEKYRCSVCNSELHVSECMGEPMYVYCPMCGAKME